MTTQVFKPDQSIYKVIDITNPTLLICCGGINGGMGIPPFEFLRLTQDININKIYIRDLNQSWYHKGLSDAGTSIEDIAIYLKNEIIGNNIKKVLITGNSAGGYAALLLGFLLEVEEVIAFAPQTFLNNFNRIIYLDNRWRKQISQLSKCKIPKEYLDLSILFEQKQLHTIFHIFFDKNVRLDRLHAQHLQKHKSIRMHEYVNGGHGLVQYLRDTGELKNILNNAIMRIVN